jgi:hypothetical protein
MLNRLENDLFVLCQEVVLFTSETESRIAVEYTRVPSGFGTLFGIASTAVFLHPIVKKTVIKSIYCSRKREYAVLGVTVDIGIDLRR